MISTKDIEIKNSGDLISKVIEPGNLDCTIYNVELRKPPYDQKAYDIVLSCEGPDLGPDFEGFFIDKDNESLGRHKGQVGRVRMSQYSFSSGETKTGIKVDRDVSMLRALKGLCVELGCEAWLEAQDNQHDTIESLFTKFNEDKPFKGIPLRMCIGGKEYTNRNGYMNYDLFFPRVSKQGKPFESTKVQKEYSKLITFNESTHLIKQKVSESVETFGNTTMTGDDFDI
jgi:hypothetical protein